VPKATVDKSKVYGPYDLKTAPPDGYVKLRKLTYGETMQRMEIGAGNVEGTRKGKMSMKVGALAMEAFEFGRCIVEHNLTDENGHLLNLGSVAGLNLLDPQIGDEIAKLINDLNRAESEEELGNLPENPTEPLTEELSETEDISPS